MKLNFSTLGTLVFLLILVSCGSKEKKQSWKDDQPRRIEMLFLGHEIEHHNSKAYFPILASALTKDGINITYTEDVNDLNAENLSLYDGLIIYANHEEITPSQEEALLSYVKEGHAFVPLHCASFCFKNSPDYINMVGAQFKEHGTGTFTTDIIKKEHPVMQNVEPFSTWDETYVHDKIADDIEVLMERVEGDHHEPWTWVKKYGEGKVFYTAYGHDERTWTHPGFQKLVKEGILWAVDDTAKKNWEAFASTIPVLQYEERANIPNYEKRDPAPKYQLPLSPEESEKLIQVPAGFKLELFASEPDIINPIAINWDEKGRLWVIETVDYPNTVRNDNGVGDDRIKICEDTDGDGKADKFTIFAENLNIPTSFSFYDGGIVVSQAPHFLFLKDTDGDDKADVREVMIDGWGTFDTHAGPSNLQYGIDNQLYGVVGYSGFEGQIFGDDFKFNQNVYRFHPKKETFEVLTNTSNNTWGLGLTEDNSIFASTANNTHSVYVGIPNALMDDIKGIPATGSLKIDGHYAMQPITDNIRQVDVFGGFTAAAGHHFYTARNYPSKYWNKMAFVCEPTGNLVHINKIKKVGAGYEEADGGNLFASSDEWVSPVEAKVGPDGNVWVADWYNFIIQHNPTPSEERGGYKAENGDGNAYVNPLRDKSRGRIWRIVPKGEEQMESLVLDASDSDELLEQLQNTNMFWRMTAQRLLVETGNTEILPELFELAQNRSQDETGMNFGAFHALWTIDGLVSLDANKEAREVVQGALRHPSAAVRKAALQMLPRTEASDKVVEESKVLYDKDASVRMAAILYLAERGPSDAIGKLLFDLSEDDTILEDSWLSKAVYAAAAKHVEGFNSAYFADNPNFSVEKVEVAKREAHDYDDSNWKTMELPQFIEDAGLNIDGIIWFRKSFEFDPVGRTYISLGPIDDSDIVYLNGTQIGVTEGEYDRNRYYQIDNSLFKKGKNVLAIRVEDTGGGGGVYGKPDQLYLRSDKKNLPLAGTWKYEVETDFSESAKNSFGGSTIAEVFVKNYASEGTANGSGEEEDDSDRVVINMKVVKNEMKFDLTEFVVGAGEKVELVLDNVDFMQHNLVIVKPGTKDKVGAAADKMAADPDGASKNYVPEMSEVLFATALINPEEKVSLKFTAPSEPGEYPYICTFPGHWRIMQGVMKVVAN
ncbi:PVC-type heme-binding CxxCH protein [Cytophaga sp. FL35]|uniref:PVC-type heme-binding CxxCH protein n=1 Tax=Cytophaga sp. FL35 TaxID=1904456 RepID=UPI0016539EC1|nr:PVC-type heme-binding CxxCH protein [Cytophaga sp. FL35]MBC6996902.1 ThuA domain-containing protein [Cytophaga sp. FL35]